MDGGIEKEMYKVFTDSFTSKRMIFCHNIKMFIAAHFTILKIKILFINLQIFGCLLVFSNHVLSLIWPPISVMMFFTVEKV